MRKIVATLCFCLTFAFILSCGRSDLTGEIREAWQETHDDTAEIPDTSDTAEEPDDTGDTAEEPVDIGDTDYEEPTDIGDTADEPEEPATGSLSCGEIYDCAINCGYDGNCQQGCIDQGTSAAQDQFYTFQICLHNNCADISLECAYTFCSDEISSCEGLNIGNSKTASCTGLPDNAQWNTASEIAQEWNGNEWLPTTEGVYDETPSTEECRFKCESGYEWNGSECIMFPECSASSGTPCTDSESGLTWSAKYGEMDWDEAVSYCENRTAGGFSNWRLPNINELRTLIQNCPGTEFGGSCLISDPDHLSYNDKSDACDGCTSNSSGIYSKLGDTTDLWSSSRIDDITYGDPGDSFAWCVRFSSGRLVSGKIDGEVDVNVFHFRCVR